MAMDFDFSAGLGAWNLQPWVGFGSSFSHSWLDSPRAMTHPALCDQREQACAILLGRQASRDPLRPQLHSVFEAQVTRVYPSIAGGLRHK